MVAASGQFAARRRSRYRLPGNAWSSGPQLSRSGLRARSRVGTATGERGPASPVRWPRRGAHHDIGSTGGLDRRWAGAAANPAVRHGRRSGRGSAQPATGDTSVARLRQGGVLRRRLPADGGTHRGDQRQGTERPPTGRRRALLAHRPGSATAVCARGTFAGLKARTGGPLSPTQARHGQRHWGYARNSSPVHSYRRARQLTSYSTIPASVQSPALFTCQETVPMSDASPTNAIKGFLLHAPQTLRLGVRDFLHAGPEIPRASQAVAPPS